MRIVVTGVTGQVGWELVRSLQPLGEVIALAASRKVARQANVPRVIFTVMLSYRIATAAAPERSTTEEASGAALAAWEWRSSSHLRCERYARTDIH